MSYISTLKTVFASFGLQDSVNWQFFTEKGKIEYHPKGAILKKAYKKEQDLRILIKGSAYSSVWSIDSNKCIDFFFEPCFCMDYSSFINQKNSDIEIITLEPCEVFTIKHSVFEKLLTESLKAEKITRIITDAHYTHKQNQQIDLLTKNPSQRLFELQTKFPIQLQKIPKQIIASYLGITPQSLSRLLKNQPILNFR